MALRHGIEGAGIDCAVFGHSSHIISNYYPDLRPVLLKLWTFQLFSRAGATGASPRDSGPDSSVKPWFRHRRASRTETIDLIQP